MVVGRLLDATNITKNSRRIIKMTKSIKSFVESFNFLICPSCLGDGEYESFCGHYTTKTCIDCGGHGIIRSLNKQKQNKKCCICKGRDGGCGGCNFNSKGLIEWESYEIFDNNLT